MPNLKLWSVLLPIVLCTLKYDKVSTFQKAGQPPAFLPDEYLIGGFVGCLYDEVCSRNEICIDDLLFGKCTSRLPGVQSNEILQPSTLEVLKVTLPHFDRRQINWRSIYIQCVIRTIIHHIKGAVYTTDPEKLCGKLPSTKQDDALDEARDLFSFVSDKGRSADTLLRLLEHKELSDPKERPKLYWSSGSAENLELFTNGLASKDDSRQTVAATLDRLSDDRENKPSEHNVENSVGYNNDNSKPSRHSEVFSYLKPLYFSNNELEDEVSQKRSSLKRRYGLRIPEEPETHKTRIRSWVWIRFNRQFHSGEAERYLRELSNRLHLASPITRFFHDRTGIVLHFQVPRVRGVDAESVVDALRRGEGNFNGYVIEDVGFGRGFQAPLYKPAPPTHSAKDFSLSLTVFASVLGFVLLLGLVYTIHACHKMRKSRIEQKANKAVLIEVEHGPKNRRTSSTDNKKEGLLKKFKNYFSRKLIPAKGKKISNDGIKTTMEQSKGQPEVHDFQNRLTRDSLVSSNLFSPEAKQKQPFRMRQNDSIGSQRSSTSSWSSEPVSCGIDLTIGHLILSYMEGYLEDEDRLTADWNAVNAYTAEEATPCVHAQKPENLFKNRVVAPLPYEQSCVKLRNSDNDYINASLLYDHTPRNPVYIATPTPLMESLADFWEMVWEQSSVVIVCLERTNELKQPAELTGTPEMTDVSLQYWPNEGIQTYGSFEVHLVSEHSSCENYVVRSFYLKNLATGETRTVTQFHYLTWSDSNLKAQVKPLLEFRRKVNRSFRGLMSPIVVHCIDGSGRTGTYILLDLVLNRIAKGVKEINIAASLEHIRDQRQGMVQNKEQYEFVFMAVAKEVDAMLKATGQNS
ncbi:hypothetical protein CRM22_007689 [Opisthorchis felineus]|uniref:Uncharacterized protein n=1 Tax=Opisthorchis felineus TaxID=147828 RepID=A0A4S2LGS1_OPIFE|nr:hypothetical protein CRM22_007689 [Opisthorchis felineus]